MNDMLPTLRLTYAELAKARGITLAAARRLTFRHKWPKQIGNDGLTRVSVPATAVDSTVDIDADRDVDRDTDSTVRESTEDNSHTIQADTGILSDIMSALLTDSMRSVAALEAGMMSLREQLDRECQRADTAESRVEEYRHHVTAERERSAQLLEELSEQRRITAMLVEQLGRRRWWRWRSR